MVFVPVTPSLTCVALLLVSGAFARPAKKEAAAAPKYMDIAAMNPPQSVFPMKAPGDAPYSLDEATLRSAIKMPMDFTFGKKMPVIMSPGTGVTGTQTFSGNFMKMLANSSSMDPVIMDIPNNLLDDVQDNAQYLAYSMNYVSAMSNNMNVSVVTWSQGSIDMQWAMKYWPSTQGVVSDFVPISPDMKGTTVATKLPAAAADIALPPSIMQQESGSNLIKTLRADGGDSAYVPTTAVYSSADEIVNPQGADSSASGFFNDARGVGVTNVQVQTACPNAAAGGKFTHEGMLYNSMAFALAMDAMMNPGPGDMKRINMAEVCGQAMSPGLTMDDKKTTDATIKIAAKNIFGYQGKKSTTEVPVKAYAMQPRGMTGGATMSESPSTQSAEMARGATMINDPDTDPEPDTPEPEVASPGTKPMTSGAMTPGSATPKPMSTGAMTPNDPDTDPEPDTPEPMTPGAAMPETTTPGAMTPGTMTPETMPAAAMPKGMAPPPTSAPLEPAATQPLQPAGAPPAAAAPPQPQAMTNTPPQPLPNPSSPSALASAAASLQSAAASLQSAAQSEQTPPQTGQPATNNNAANVLTIPQNIVYQGMLYTLTSPNPQPQKEMTPTNTAAIMTPSIAPAAGSGFIYKKRGFHHHHDIEEAAIAGGIAGGLAGGLADKGGGGRDEGGLGGLAGGGGGLGALGGGGAGGLGALAGAL